MDNCNEHLMREHFDLLAHFPDWRNIAEADDQLEAKVFLQSDRAMVLVSRIEDSRVSHNLVSHQAQTGLTQEELAERMGKGKPSTATLEKLARATGIRLRNWFEPDVRPE